MRVTVDGNIGCGKSTLLRALGALAGSVGTAEEPLARWAPWLERLYDPASPSGAMEFQLRVWLDRCAAAPQPAAGVTDLFVERSPLFQQQVFLESNRRLGRITEPGVALLNELYDGHTAWAPDVYVYLRSDPAACAARIQARGRSCEGGIPLDYLQLLHEAHEAACLRVVAARGCGRVPAGAAVVCVDVEGKTPAQVVEAVLGQVYDDESDPRVNWRAVEQTLLDGGVYSQVAPWQEVPAWVKQTLGRARTV